MAFLLVNVSFMMLLTFQFYIIDIYFIPTVVCVFFHYYCNIIVLCYISLYFRSLVNSIFFDDTGTFCHINFISLIFVLFLSVSA